MMATVVTIGPSLPPALATVKEALENLDRMSQELQATQHLLHRFLDEGHKKGQTPVSEASPADGASADVIAIDAATDGIFLTNNTTTTKVTDANITSIRMIDESVPDLTSFDVDHSGKLTVNSALLEEETTKQEEEDVKCTTSFLRAPQSHENHASDPSLDLSVCNDNFQTGDDEDDSAFHMRHQDPCQKADTPHQIDARQSSSDSELAEESDNLKTRSLDAEDLKDLQAMIKTKSSDGHNSAPTLDHLGWSSSSTPPKRYKRRSFRFFFRGKNRNLMDESGTTESTVSSSSTRVRSPPPRNNTWSASTRGTQSDCLWSERRRRNDDTDSPQRKQSPPLPPQRSISSKAALMKMRWSSGRTKLVQTLRAPRRHNSREGTLLFPPRLTAQPRTLKSLNIFCSDMVSNAFIQTKFQQLKESPHYVQVELEDCLTNYHTTSESFSIPYHLKDLLARQDRPWEGIRMVDELLDGWFYPTFQANRQQFLQALGSPGDESVVTSAAGAKIPISFQTKIRLTDQLPAPQVEEAIPLEDVSNMETTTALTKLIQLIQEFQKDLGIVKLVLTLTPSLQQEQEYSSLFQSLTELLQCDDRQWEEFVLKLEQGEDAAEEWPLATQEALQGLDQICKTMRVRGIIT